VYKENQETQNLIYTISGIAVGTLLILLILALLCHQGLLSKQKDKKPQNITFKRPITTVTDTAAKPLREQRNKEVKPEDI